MTYAIPGPIRTNIVSSTSVGGIDSPFTRTRAVLDMMKGLGNNESCHRGNRLPPNK